MFIFIKAISRFIRHRFEEVMGINLPRVRASHK